MSSQSWALGERPGLEAAEVGAAAHLATDQSCVLQRPDVFRGGRERHRERIRQLADRPLAAGQFAQHPPAGRIAEGVENGIELTRR